MKKMIWVVSAIAVGMWWAETSRACLPAPVQVDMSQSHRVKLASSAGTVVLSAPATTPVISGVTGSDGKPFAGLRVISGGTPGKSGETDNLFDRAHGQFQKHLGSGAGTVALSLDSGASSGLRFPVELTVDVSVGSQKRKLILIFPKPADARATNGCGGNGGTVENI